MNPLVRFSLFRSVDKTLVPFSGMIFFWAIFDGIISYTSPLLFSSAGLSSFELGLVLGSSSVFGAIFDLILSRFVRNPNYRKLYLIFFALCSLIPFILLEAKTIPFFLMVMFLWGVYLDFVNFANLDFVSKLREDKRTFYFSIIALFTSIGYIVAPVLAGIAVSDEINSHIFILMWVMLGISFVFFILLSLSGPKQKSETGIHEIKSIKRELISWSRLGRIMWAPLIFTVLLCVYDSFFFTVGPLIAESYENIQPYNGLIISAFSVPALLTVMYAARVADKFGKKKTAFIGLLLAAIPLCAFPWVESPLVLTALIFISGIASSFCIPAINAVYTDYICEVREYEETIEGLGDFMTNMGYFIGPIAAGFVAETIGYLPSFGILGVVLIISVLFLIRFTPKNVDVSRIYEMQK